MFCIHGYVLALYAPGEVVNAKFSRRVSECTPQAWKSGLKFGIDIVIRCSHRYGGEQKSKGSVRAARLDGPPLP